MLDTDLSPREYPWGYLRQCGFPAYEGVDNFTKGVQSSELDKKVFLGSAGPGFRFSRAFSQGVSAPPAGSLQEGLSWGAQSPVPPTSLSRPPQRPPSGARQPGAWEGTARHWLLRGTERRDQRGLPDSGKPRPLWVLRAAQPGPSLPCPAPAARCERPRVRGPPTRQLCAAGASMR